MLARDSYIQARSASEINNMFRGVIDLTLGIATQGYFDPSTPSESVDLACLVNADFHELAARHGGVAVLDEAEEQRLSAEGRDSAHLDHLRRLVRSAGGKQVISDASLRSRLDHIGVAAREQTKAQDRLLMHRAISEGQRRATFFNDPRVISSGDPLHYLMTEGGALTARSTKNASSPEAPTPAAEPAKPAEQPAPKPCDSPLLSTLIDPIVDNIVSAKVWTVGVGEDARRLLKEFVWMIGDKPCLEYSQTDLANFRSELWRMPNTVRVQSIWHIPYSKAKIKFPKLTEANRRSNKTVNKDLSYISTFSKQMIAVGHWPENFINPLALATTVTAQEKSSGRFPWKPEHLKAIFSCPNYTGSGGSRRRLKAGNAVYQDAAYWMPLLAAYQLGRSNEHAGHLVSDFVFDQGTPHMLIRPNEYRELKTKDSERFMPIHPRLLELGIQAFVEAAAERGEELLFPELWLNASKKGSGQYYSVSWTKVITWLRNQPDLVIPCTPGGKEADFHSIRSTGLSQLDRHNINQNIVADIAGHAREGTTARSYQNLLESGGLEDVLRERLAVLERLPDYAAAVSRHPLKVMHVNVRTR